ncbi:MAG: undecaprenyl/decaprenyl-phosphate alpha-N-acetylglucosaminyl 1-phosphate transferase [Duncaniella sp.]|nr:undecaprenyl/decaprenyl-phosphate alpha-N-acetylglucosaminyl 1-phosphate transferase [Duncaniella sp.]
MAYWSTNILITFALCILLAGILIPQILLIAYRKNLFDEVDERKIHKGAIPRLGGFAFQPVIMLSIALMLGANIVMGYPQFAIAFTNDLLLMIATFCSVLLLYLVGIADDLIGIKYRAKFVVQIICAILIIYGGAWFDSLGGIFGINELPVFIGYPFTAIIIVFLINAINLIDGIDGLASGLSSIAVIIFGISFFVLGDYALSILAFATLGVLCPFFYYNVFGNVKKHSKIFMGDAGSLTIGVLLCILGIKLYTADTGELDFNPVVLAFSPLIVPCFDVVRVYMLRIRQHRSPFLPDKNHIHHKLLAAGLKPRLAMITIISVSVAFTLFNLAISSVINLNLVVIIDILLWVMANIWISRVIARRNAELESQKA